VDTTFSDDVHVEDGHGQMSFVKIHQGLGPFLRDDVGRHQVRFGDVPPFDLEEDFAERARRAHDPFGLVPEVRAVELARVRVHQAGRAARDRSDDHLGLVDLDAARRLDRHRVGEVVPAARPIRQGGEQPGRVFDRGASLAAASLCGGGGGGGERWRTAIWRVTKGRV